MKQPVILALVSLEILRKGVAYVTLNLWLKLLVDREAAEDLLTIFVTGDYKKPTFRTNIRSSSK